MRFYVLFALSVVWGVVCASQIGVGAKGMLAGIIGGGLIGGAVAFTRRHKV